MKKILLSILALTTLLGTALAMPAPALAEGPNCVQTSILGNGEVCDNGEGDSIKHILDLVVDIMTIGIGILGVVGISVVGVQYLTAGGSEEKTRKAKRRLFEIVIGLVAYALIYAVLNWLLPGFNTN